MKNFILTLIILFIFIYALLNSFHPLTIGILGAINIVSFAVSYINLKEK